VLVPGQLVTREIVDYLAGLLRSQKQMELHGIAHDGYIPCLRVLTAPEERGLHRID
jgi:arginine decarboxylase